MSRQRTGTVRDDQDLGSARALLSGIFALDGFVFATWVSRIPQIKHQVGASAGMLGLALLCVSAGAVATMVITGRLCTRFGSRRVALAGVVLLGATVALPPLAHRALTLGAILFVFGAAYGGINVSMNAVAVDVVRLARRPIMPSFHAAFSAGGLLGAALGGLAAAHVSPAWHLGLVGALTVLLGTALALPLLRHPLTAPPAPDTEPRDAEPPEARPAAGPAAARVVVVLCGLIALCSAYGEGAIADWTALHLRDDLHTSASLATSGFAAFSLAMAFGRTCGSRLLAVAGQTAVLAGGALTACAGMLVAALSPLLAVSVAGYVLVGLGLSNLFPAAMASAGAAAGPDGVAVASTFGYGGMLVGPPVIGFLTEGFGLPVALTTISMLAAVAAGIALRLRAATA